MANEPINKPNIPGEKCQCLACQIKRSGGRGEPTKTEPMTHVWITGTGKRAYQSRARALTYLRECHILATEAAAMVHGIKPSKITVTGEVCFYYYRGRRIAIKKTEVII